MYRTIGGSGSGAFRDGLFSQADPYQAFQSSLRQAGDGSLGAVSRLAFTRSRKRPSMRGLGSNTFLQAFRDGSLGDDPVVPAAPGLSVSSATDLACSTIASCSQITTLQTDVKDLNQKLLIGGGALAVGVLYLIFKK